MMNLEELKKVAIENGIKPRLEKLSPRIAGITYKTKRQHYHILINRNISRELQQKTLAHELSHISNDLCEYDRIIGIDMQYTKIEKSAREIAQAVMQA